MKNIVTATFQPGYTTAKVLGLWQYDYGQILRIQGLELPDTIEIHFSLQEKGGESERQVGVTRDGVTEVSIPNSYLENAGTSRDYSIYAFLYISDGKSGNTEYKITMHVQSRPKPKDPETPEDPKKDPFGETVEVVNKAMESARASAEAAAESEKSASESAARAEKSAVESQKSAESAAESEKAAATSATAAAQSASQSRESAATARSAADQAAKSATAAAESATTAAQLAENATRSATNASGSAESASQSAETAKTAADAAGKSASAAQQAVRSAAESASTATAAAQTATTAVGNAAESATTANQSAETAGQKATAAETAASNAAESATAAEKSATAAGDSASAAKASETAAGEAAQTAQEQAERITDSAEQIEKNKAGVAALKEDISNKITKFYASNQGETHLADSDNGKIMDMMLYGKSEQKQYSGKNLINSDEYYSEYKQSDGTYKGMANDFNDISVPISKYIETQITVSCKVIVPPDTSMVLIEATINGTVTRGNGIKSSKSGVAAITITPKTESDTIRITYGAGGRGIIVVSEFQIEKGSEATSYEPYVGGQPSPSPDYPQEIKSVVNPIVKVTGKNLLNSRKIKRTNNLEINDDGSITIFQTVQNSGSSIGIFSNICPECRIGCSYILSLNSEKLANNKFYALGENKTYLLNTPFILSSKLMNSEIFLYGSEEKTKVTNLMVRKAADSGAYEPYTKQSIQLPITLNAIPVTSGGNVTIDGQQYISDYVDVERGKVVRNMESFFLNGSEDWAESEKRTFFFIQYVSAGNNYDITYCFSDIGEAINYQILDDKSGFGISYMYTWRINLQQCNIIDGKTSDDLKLYLSNHPINAIIKLKTPIEEDLSVEQAQALKELSTIYPVTNITVGSEQLDGYTVFNYPISMENGWNYVKKQLNDNRDYIYDMDTQSAEAYVNSEYAVALTELEV